MEQIKKIIELLDNAIKDEPANTLMAGDIIKDAYDSEVDEYRNVINNAKDWLAGYQQDLVSKTGISNLKIKYTSASGYFIEVSKSSVSKVSDEFVHKQTLVNAARFITPELKEFELKLIDGEGILAEREYKIFSDVREQILNSFSEIKQLSETVSFIDFSCSMAQVAYNNNYVRPEITNDYGLKVISGRHPVIETNGKEFISNNLDLSKKKFVNIITGPNMGGKSTFLRQNALIILLAHIGSFVPAASARIPLCDKIFSRVGASDNLYLGQSTFMVEMQEMANILNNSTNKSFVIIDEIGRGTSTYDGMSLAWAILRHNHDTIGAKTLFATHYHELVDDSMSLSGVANFSVAVGENDTNLVFLRKIIPGSIKKSYGLEVARIAGINDDVINEARSMLKTLEIEHNKIGGEQLSIANFSIKEERKEQSLEEKRALKLIKALQKIDVNSLTPIEALNKLSELKNKI